MVLAGEQPSKGQEVYPHNSFAQIKEYCKAQGIDLCQYVMRFEGDVLLFALDVWHTMKEVIEEGLRREGVLPGGLNVVRRAKQLYFDSKKKETAQSHEDRIVAAYAFAVGEQNADGGLIVTAPTCGASGVLPAVFRYTQEEKGLDDLQVAKALLVSGVVGNLVKTNASVSGAECGCQAEIGTACAMAAAGAGVPQRHEHRGNGIQRRGGAGTSLGAYVRSRMRIGADPLYRAQRRGGNARHKRRQPCKLSYRQ